MCGGESLSVGEYKVWPSQVTRMSGLSDYIAGASVGAFVLHAVF